MLGSGKSLENVMRNKGVNKALAEQQSTKPQSSNSSVLSASNVQTSSAQTNSQVNKYETLSKIISNLTSAIQTA